MRRFFLPAGSLAGETITLTGAEARHIARVLRLRPGRAVEFFDGRGGASPLCSPAATRGW